MTEYVPTTEQVEYGFSNDSEEEYRDPVGYAYEVKRNRRMFRTWLNAELARAWDEGHSAHPYFGVNPYRKQQA